MKLKRDDLYVIDKKYFEQTEKFHADERNTDWQKYCLLASTKLLECQQTYARQAAKDLARMVSTGELNMEKITTIKTVLKETSEKEFVKPECKQLLYVTDNIESIIDYLKNYSDEDIKNKIFKTGA